MNMILNVPMVECFHHYTCECGAVFTMTFTLPDAIYDVGEIVVRNEKCSICDKPIILSGGVYHIENGELKLQKS